MGAGANLEKRASSLGPFNFRKATRARRPYDFARHFRVRYLQVHDDRPLPPNGVRNVMRRPRPFGVESAGSKKKTKKKKERTRKGKGRGERRSAITRTRTRLFMGRRGKCNKEGHVEAARRRARRNNGERPEPEDKTDEI